MNTRIALVRKNNGLNQQEFAKALGLTKNFISLLETGGRSPSDRTINDICRIYHIREAWLRTGELPMQQSCDRQEEITQFVKDAMKDASQADTMRILTALMDASPAEIEAIANFARRIAEQAPYISYPKEVATNDSSFGGRVATFHERSHSILSSPLTVPGPNGPVVISRTEENSENDT